MTKNTFETPLCKIAHFYGADKCPQLKHNYTPYYYEMFKKRIKTTKVVFEMGIGYYKNIKNVDIVYDPGLKRWYHKGASLKMWRDFFPNAQIIGADKKSDCLFQEKRIKTYLCNQNDIKQVENLFSKIGKNIDIFIDDASHNKESQVALAKVALPFLRKDVIYIIEDVAFPAYVEVVLKDYNCKVIECSKKWRDDHLVIIKNHE